ncbi:MAG: ATP-dependent protease, ATPase subunit domain protein [Micavibrio sp.]|nr:ATP-dependent protease, ATPase subunit domain protein [Micavibrio sp.]
MTEAKKTKNFVISDEELEDNIRQYCRDFTALAKAGRFPDPITGRDDEIDQTILILLQRGRKNAVLLAPAGVGKTAMVVGLAQTIARGDVPDYLKDCRVIELELPSMAAGTESIAEFQGRFIPICKGLAERYHDPDYPKFVMFIDEMHTIMPTCLGSSYKGLSEVMKPYMTVGDLHIIGATTLDEYRIYVAQDPAMDRRFQRVTLKVPNTVETISIMKHLKGGYEKHHGITINDTEIERIVRLTDEHLRRRYQPDKSILMMDAAMAYHVKMHGRGVELSKESIYHMISKESAVHAQALEAPEGGETPLAGGH